MKYYRCKCGHCESWSSMGVAQCAKCPKCGSDLAQHPDYHHEPAPHDFSLIEQVQTDEGPKPLTRCKFCLKTPAEVAA